MAIYRVLEALEKGTRIFPLGGFVRTGELPEETLTRLEQMGRVARIAAPPLASLPGCELRAAHVERAVIIDAERV